MKNAQITAMNAAATASQNSAPIDVGQAISLSFQPIFSVTDATGTVKIQMSNDNPGPSGKRINGDFVPTNWSDIPSATSTVTAGVAPPIVIAQSCFSYVRVVFTRSAGTGTVTVLANILSV